MFPKIYIYKLGNYDGLKSVREKNVMRIWFSQCSGTCVNMPRNKSIL